MNYLLTCPYKWVPKKLKQDRMRVCILCLLTLKICNQLIYLFIRKERDYILFYNIWY